MYERGKPAEEGVRYFWRLLVADMVLDLGFVDDLRERKAELCWLIVGGETYFIVRPEEVESEDGDQLKWEREDPRGGGGKGG